MRASVVASTLDLPPDDLRGAIERLIAAGIDGFHLDVADGRFVPRRAGSLALARLLASTGLPFDVHLMVKHPSRLAGAYAAAGARTVYVHVETSEAEIHRAGEQLGGADAGLALRVETPLSAADPYVHAIDSLLLLGVPAGRGGQPMDAAAPARLEAAATRFPSLHRCHDGGLTLATRGELDAPLLVAGRVLATGDLATTIAALRG